MADPVLVPPTPVITQTDSPEVIQQTVDNVQKIFDKVAPKIRGTPTPELPPEPKQPDRAATAPVEPSKETPAVESKPPVQPPDKESRTLPSFLETEITPAQTPTQPDEEWPEELPTFKNSDEAKTRYKTWREKYQALKTENKTFKERPSVDPTITEKLTFLENQNKEMQGLLQKSGIERSRQFQQKILAPMNAAWTEASRIVTETGGDPKQLARALSLNGREHFEALDEIFSGMPESAKIEANNAINAYRRHDAARRQALADAPRTAEAIKKAELQEQYATVQRQRTEMEGLWEAAGRKLRDEAKVEVMQRSNDPGDKWWNDQIDADEETSRRLFLDNTDMEKVAIAMRLAPMVDRYRQLWLQTRAELKKTKSTLADKFGSEPNLSESGGNVRNGSKSTEEQLKRPFTDVFLEEFHRQQAQGVR